MHIRRVLPALALFAGLLPLVPQPATRGPAAHAAVQAAASCQSSPFSPPTATDDTFVVDCGPGLDTGCTYRGGGPLVINLKIDRVIGDKAKLLASGLISPTATLQLPAFDIDFFGGGGSFQPERDRVFFNGNVVPSEYLQGDDGIWRLNEFDLPIEWVNFPDDPGERGTVTPADNYIRVDIDTANSPTEVWCMAIDWAVINVDVVRPIVMAHGIFSSGGTWAGRWVPTLDGLGIPNTNELDMGWLDSIQNNAAEIATVVAASRQRWGVDKVNIVAHSKGGLDSREFVEFGDSVERLIQLGTPNAGSPLADVAQGLVAGTIGLPAAVVVNALAGPAGVQLTTPYMALYNGAHGANPEVEYTALAGDYRCPCPGLMGAADALLLAITGTGDTIVPVSSVYALPFIQSRPPFPSSGGITDAKHTSLTGSADVLATVLDRVQAFPARAAALPTAPSTAARTTSFAGLLQQGETSSQPIPMDQAGTGFFSLLYPSGNIDLTLISPSGNRITSGGGSVEHSEGAIPGGMLEVFRFPTTEVGNWRAEVTATSVTEPSGSVGFAVMGWLQNPATTLDAVATKPAVHLNEPLQLVATPKSNGAPVTGAAVEARLAGPSSTASVMLHDDGRGGDVAANDGTYTGLFPNTDAPGIYRINFSARGTLPGGAPFGREVFSIATVSASSSTADGPFADLGEDRDGDGLFDVLTVHSGATVTATANYRIVGTLIDSAGTQHTASRLLTLGPGGHTVSLSFDGEAIYQQRVDGPYTFSIRIIEETSTGPLPVDERANVHQTKAYQFRSFDHAPITLTGNGSASGADTNGNNRFDLLRVGIEVDVRSAGFYQWSARLVDTSGNDLGFATNSGSLLAGDNVIELTFDGEVIGRNGVDGPYAVRGLLMFGTGRSLVAGTAFTTPPFGARQFEGFVNDTTPPSLEVSASPSELSLPNHRLSPVSVAITVADDMDESPTVKLVSIVADEAVNGRGDGNTEADIDEAAFGTDDRAFLLRAERSGLGRGRTYTITYSAEDAAGNAATASTQVVVPHDARRPR